MATDRVRRVRCQDGHGEPIYLAVTVRRDRIYILCNGTRVLLDQESAVHLMTAVGECHWCLVHGEFYDDGRPGSG